MKLVSELHDFISFGIVFHRDAPETEKLVLKGSVLGLGRLMNRDVARVLEQIKRKKKKKKQFKIRRCKSFVCFEYKHCLIEHKFFFERK